MFVPTPHPRRPGLVPPVRADPRGLRGPTPAEVRRVGWRRTTTGWFLPSHVDSTVTDQRILDAATVVGDRGVVTGWAALHWLGGRWFEGLGAGGQERPVPLLTRLHVQPRPGILITQERCSPQEIVLVDGLRLTIPVRSVCFEMRYAPSELAALTALDMAAYSDLVSLAEMRAYVETRNGWTGIPLCRAALASGEENAWSPAEVEMRSIWVANGHGRPQCNAPLFTPAGRHVGTPDLLDVDAGVLGQYDGGLHAAGRVRAADVRKDAAYRALGLETVTMLAADRADGHRDFLTRLADAYARAERRAGEPRPWTAVPPPWWVDTRTVEARRGLTADQRRRFLRYRNLSDAA